MDEKVTIVGLRISARNNYTQKTEQDITTWSKASCVTQADVAMALDRAADEATERRGYSGSGSGADLLAILSDDTEDRVDGLQDPMVLELPSGSLSAVRKFIASRRGSTAWNGHNHIPCCRSHSEQFVAAQKRSVAAAMMGSASTPAKQAAARENGKLGGRPAR